METFKTFEIFKNSSRDCLERSDKSWNTFPKKFPTNNTLNKKFSQNTVSTLSLKNLQKTEKCYFQRFRTFKFDLKFDLKFDPKLLPMTKFWFKQFLKLHLPFQENGFNFVTQKIAKNWKMSFLNVQNIRFWPQGSVKTIF